ncbi:MAG: transaldolase [Acidobacteria bacterium]|nr:transaldolase [Acidobacteriota bacterium]
MSRLVDLHARGGQSPWLDYLRRDHLEDGTIAALVSRGVRGLTSNPSIFEAALRSTGAYDAPIAQAARAGGDAEGTFWDIACGDVGAAADLFADLYRESGGEDGYVSIEVDPRLAHDAEGTVEQAVSLWSRLDRPNVMIKVPATPAGVHAVEELLARAVNVNVTLIFGLARYAEVVGAHQRGLERLAASDPGALRHTASVASFFVSRVDSLLDPQLPGHLRGRAAIAQATLAWSLFRERYSGGSWRALADRGAMAQRPLWASTSTKNPAYPDTLYVDALVAPGTVNTLPLGTLQAFDDHGSPEPVLEDGLASARDAWAEVSSVVDVAAAASRLESEGVAAFESSIDSVLAAVASRLAQGR